MFRSIICLVFLIFKLPWAFAAETPSVAAAADLKFALTIVAERFQRETGSEVKLVFGSSGNLKEQIREGAPFEIFLSADEKFVFELSDQKLTRDRGALYGVGRLVLFTPHGSKVSGDASFSDLKAAIADGRIKRFAIANPDHAPYGRAARAALKQAGIWEKIEPKLVLGENAAQAMQFAASGSCQGGIVPLSLSKSEEVSKLGAFAVIPADWHKDEPLQQRMVLMKRAGSVAAAFYDYLKSAAARETFVRYGFTLPGEVSK